MSEHITFPSGPFDVIYADPPWLYYGDPNKDQGDLRLPAMERRLTEGS